LRKLLEEGEKRGESFCMAENVVLKKSAKIKKISRKKE